MKENKSQIIIYQTETGETKLEVRFQDDTVWLTQVQMTELFQTTKQNISLHINNVFKEGELQEVSVVKEYLTTASDGKDYRTKYYNLDVIISVGYRVKSHRGTQFRIWATKQLREYFMQKSETFILLPLIMIQTPKKVNCFSKPSRTKCTGLYMGIRHQKLFISGQIQKNKTWD